MDDAAEHSAIIDPLGSGVDHRQVRLDHFAIARRSTKMMRS
jgi:hypothetical protein